MLLRTMLRRAGILAVLVVGATGACSASASFGGGDASDAAVELIDGQLSEQLGVDFEDATCEQPEDPAKGDTFACTASVGGAVVQFRAEMTEDDRVNVENLDLVFTDAALAEIENASAGALSEQVGQELPVENFDCGAGPAIVGDPFELPCALTDPVSGDVYDVTVGFDADGNFLGVDVAPTAR